MECPICCEIINDNDTLLLSCCNKYVHKYCIDNWVLLNKNKNKEIHLCVFCKKNNNYINDLLINITESEDQDNNNSSNDTFINPLINNNNYRYNNFTIFITTRKLVLYLLIIFIIFYLIFQY